MGPFGHSRAVSGFSVLFGLLLLLVTDKVSGQRSADVGFSLHPPSFNLAQGAKIRASATCGEEKVGSSAVPRMDLYCKLVGGPATSPTLGHTIQGQFCDFCNSADPKNAHPISNAIDGTERWWQSPPLSLGLEYNEVNVTIDLGQLFHVAYVLIKFANSPRPDLWILERSVDFGRIYSPWQYFANSKIDCLNYFNKETRQPITRDDDVICTTEYSRIVPLENGEIVVSLINGRPGAKYFMDAPVLRDFTKATNIRLRFLRTNTLLGHLISKAQRDPTVTRRYYYSIKDISIGGRCVCHGHADTCDLRNNGNQNLYNCQCQHNTCGEICDQCCPGFNQKRWKPASVDAANECEACNCHGHASDCYYDADVDNRKASLDIYGQYRGGGVCINCQHNTAGVNCEKCAIGYYRPYGVLKDPPHSCISCGCSLERSHGCEEGSGRCFCKSNFSGEKCDQCAEGFYNYPRCVRVPYYPSSTTDNPEADCKCTGPGVINNNCHIHTGICYCRTGFQGAACDRCAVGHFHYPFCQRCSCHPTGVVPEICDSTGKCLCHYKVKGTRCDQCRPGYHSFPNCYECNCDMFGAADPSCDSTGQCHCHKNYAGPTCDQCALGYFSFPSCAPCQCSSEGSYQSGCDPFTGQCDCLPGITGQRCDKCASGSDSFPLCQGISGECDPAGTVDIQAGYCQCLPHVEGLSCNQCKPLYWNLARENPSGCADCNCDLKGTVSGVGECHKTQGDCYCKSNVCGAACDTCKEGYFLLESRSNFGCRGCKCDVGGAISHLCAESSGACSCRNNIEGLKCNQPKLNHYFPDLYQMKFEIEDGRSPIGRDVRFGYDPIEFPNFSWRGYAQMTTIQREVRVIVNVETTNLNLFRIILRYINPELHPVIGHITAFQSRSSKGTFQSKEIVFPTSKDPAFVTVPGKSFAEPFSLAPGMWNINLIVEGVLLDYLVLLPSDFYEGSILQLRVTEPCTRDGHVGERCLVYQHLPMDRFPCVLGTEVEYFRKDGVKRPIFIQRANHGLPPMADISGRQVGLPLPKKKKKGVFWGGGGGGLLPRFGTYVLVVEYANEDLHQYTANVAIGNSPVSKARVTLYSCNYIFLCRSIVVDNMNRIAVFELLSTNVEIHLEASSIHFLLHKVCIIPAEEFFVEYAEPKVQCVGVYGRSPSQRPSCVQSSFYENPPLSVLLDTKTDAKGERGQSYIYLSVKEPGLPAYQGNGVLLKSPQNSNTLNRRIPHTGRYVFIAQYFQPLSPTFPVTVRVIGGANWSGSFNASFCPQLFGCRDLVIASNRIALDVTNPDLSVTVEVPKGKSLVLEYILLVPTDGYTQDLLHEKPVDKSFNFINICGENSFYIDPVNSPEFCRNSAISLVAKYNNGALPCNCNLEGATAQACNPHECNCGRRLCDEVTGKCICPPQTLKPKCEVCDQQSFSYHPLVGCEGCNCSTLGTVQPEPAQCNGISGQCICKPRISGRQCDHCSLGHFRFPHCFPCDCNLDGTKPEICSSHTGACMCKENVSGLKCDSCRSGSFHLNSKNPRGCTACFCFGATDICHSSNKYRKKFVDMRSWRLETPDQAGVAVIYNPGSNSVVADVQELPPSVHSLYWVAPESYLGQRISSYGGYLTYQLKSFGLPNEGMVLLDKRPDVLLTGRQMTIVYVDPNNPLPDKQYYGHVELIEGNFRHASSNSRVSREEFMMILSKLENLHIRALYFSETQRLTLTEVGLDDITASGSGPVASSMEICTCPPEYSGDSCQQCAPGYYHDTNGLFLGKCVPCRCNGHSSRCEDGSGKCINCQHNTAGDNCEICKESYTGNATLGTCRLCPCPLSVPSNSFATGCVGTGKNMRCMCKAGYAGVSCERCAHGYYGNPLKFGGKCQPCNCGNNGQLRSCDPLTGECLDEEPKDNGIDDNSDSCDSCVTSLLMELSVMGDELNLIKARLQNLNANSQALEQIKALEARIREVKLQHERYSSKLESQRVKVNKMEIDTNSLKQEITALLRQAETNVKKYETISMNAEDTFRNATHLLLTIELLIKNINILIKEVASAEGGAPSGDLGKNMAEAQRMLNEMRKRTFSSQKIEAENEKDEARALLNRVKNQFQKLQDQNKDLIRNITNSINDYESKLNDLRAALDEANTQTDRANNINKDNAALLQDIKNKVKDLSQQQKEATSRLNTAESSLEQTSSMLRLLQNSKEAWRSVRVLHKEYEKLAAQLDGAKQELNEKVNLLSKAASKEPLVIMAEKHAQSLQDLANQLTELKRNISSEDLVRCAIDAANAYDGIINAVKEAEEAANKAKEASDSALTKVESEDLPGKAKKAKSDSEDLLDQAKKTQKSLQDINPELEDIKDRLVEAKENKKQLSGELSTVQDSINGIKRDDIGTMINSAKELVQNANTITTNVLKELNPIKDDINNLKDTIGTTQNANYNEALEEASNSVKNLTGSLPDLFEAMNRINNLMPLGNISESVSRIRELIQQARDAANKVVVPMRFDGNSGVEVRPPSNLEDLKAYTYLSFFLQRPKPRSDRRKRQLFPRMFVMYLGRKDASKDYIGIAVDDDKLMCVYNLGGNEEEIMVDTDISLNNPEEAIMDRVVLERIYQYLILNYTKAFTSTKPDPVLKYQTDVTQRILLNLDPSDVVFYVGGFPADFKPPRSLDFPNYKGCIELDYLNQNGISLYNFKRAFNLNTTTVQPCRRYKEESEKSFFEGTGYASILSNSPPIKSLRYEQTIQTTTDAGLLFFAENGTSYISLNIEDGILVLLYQIESGTVKKIKSSNGRVSDGNEHVVALRISTKDKTVLVLEQSSIAINASDVDAFTFNIYYLGGIPSMIREQFNIDSPPFRGCVKNVKTPTSSATFKETFGVSRKCSDDWNIVRSAQFDRDGTLGLKPDGFPFPGNFQTAFGFQTSQPSASLLTYKTQSDELRIALEEGTVKVNTRNNELQSKDKYLDGNTHYVSVMREGDQLRLLVDNEQVTTSVGSSGPPGNSPGDITFGGSKFEGCITNVFIQRASKVPTVENLVENNEKKKVSLGTCRVDEPPLPLILNDYRSYSFILDENDMMLMNSMNNVMKTNQKEMQECSADSNITLTKGSFQFGDSKATHLLYELNKQLLKDRSHFSLDIRISEPGGLIFLMTDKEETSHLALHISKGRFVFSLGTKGNKLKIRSQDKYNDGKWHTVVFGWDGFTGQMIVDGINSRKGTLTKYFGLEKMTSVRLGGMKSVKIQAVPQKSFSGCLKNVKLNSLPLEGPPSHTVGVTPCYDGPFEHGIFFAKSGGYIVLDNSFSLKMELEMVFNVRPQSQSSVLLYTGNIERGLSLYIEAGKVTLSVKNGADEVLVSIKPQRVLCDGQWHTIKVIQKQSVVQLEVDKELKKSTGPKSVTQSSTASPLFIGGVPAALEAQRLPVKSSFNGCMKNVNINNKIIDFTKISTFSGAISLGRCPVS
ncbi:hypothetical protein GDO86_011115 [Hymenochirus boettgeri]|uniref:Laminin subunit alpha 3 n=1 Tax=Hymenochirus boettgeri TaxID=247094 RepID=A0A8T2JHV0_9PIPI|nr:hypothetical protein GDO86_011115 [Hymenochirus boettgeri]